MIDIQSISAGLALGKDGIWYSSDDERISYPSEGNHTYFAIEEQSFWFKHRNNCIAAAVKALPPRQNGPIFDIGGGNGFVALGLMREGYNVVLIEPGKAGAVNAKKRGVHDVICATTTTAKIRPNVLPAIGLFDVIEHIENDKAFLESIWAFLEPQGRLYLTVPAYQFLWSTEDDAAGHFRRYSLNSICNLLASVGFNIDYKSYIFQFLPIPIFMMRTLPSKLRLIPVTPTKKTIHRDHGVSTGLLTRLLDGLLQRETDSIRQRKRIPFGGSCLVVCSRL